MKMDFKLRVPFFFLLINTFISQLSAQECFSARGELGTCVEIRQCPPFVQILKTKPLSNENVEYLQKSRCLNYAQRGSAVFVCCPSNTYIIPSTSTYSPLFNVRESTRPPQNLNVRNHPLLPSDCGEQNDDRIVGGERTDIDEFPWAVLLEYQTFNRKTTQCGGVLISKRYVLTAAHCIRNLPSSVTLLSVRLGEYDKNQEIDCISQGGFETCADPIVSIPIEEEIVHEGYLTNSRGNNDIALLRLAGEVTFTNFIQPICLPQSSNIGQLLDVVGWGRTETGFSSAVKLKVKVPFVPQDQCARVYQFFHPPQEIGAGQICAGGVQGKDSCAGDSGGPLMMRKKDDFGIKTRWVSVGVVSFGPKSCGLKNIPGVYTKVHDYVPWILSKLRP